MLQRIHELEKAARTLEPSAGERRDILETICRYTDNFIENIPNNPTYSTTPDQGRGIYDSAISDHPIKIDEALDILRTNVDAVGINPASGGHLGYIPGGGIVYSAYGDFLADITNRYAGIFFANPGAVRMENMLLDWMADLVGYPKGSVGNLTSGGSVSNLIAVVTARDAFGLEGQNFGKTVVYLSKQVHHSLDKALRIAGMKACHTRYIPMDDRYRLQPAALEEAIDADRKAGLIPWMVVASAGTTDVGAVDPLGEIGELVRSRGLWYHIDAAYGGFFALCDLGRRILAGMETSDSIVMDPHKGLFLPYGSGAILVKDKQKMLDAHYYMPNYLLDTLRCQEELSPADLSPELTKHFRGLRLWLPLKLLGLAPFRACLEEKILLARYFYEELSKLERFEIGPYPDLSVVTYRYIPARGDQNAFNKRLLEEIHKDGRVFVSSTILDGKFVLRLAVLAFRTHLETIDLMIEILAEKVKLLEES